MTGVQTCALPIYGRTNKPIDLALVRVVSNSGKLIKTYVSDFKGRVLPYMPDDQGKLLIERVEYKDSQVELHKKGYVEKQKLFLFKSRVDNFLIIKL